jgi:magnesium chelatase family protein
LREGNHKVFASFLIAITVTLCMLFRTKSAAVYGIDAHIIDVEVDVSAKASDKDLFTTVGLPDAAVRESRERVRSALRNSGYDVPAPTSR